MDMQSNVNSTVPTIRILGALLVLALSLALPVRAAGEKADQEDLETFRGDLAACVDQLDTMPTPLLEQVYDDPAVLDEARKKIAELSPTQLEALRNALQQIPYWQSLPATLGSGAGEGTGAFDFGAALDVLAPSRDPEQFREKWMGFFDKLDGIPEETAGKAFFDRVGSVKARMAEMTPDELGRLETAMREKVPQWREALRQRAERNARQGKVDVVHRNVPEGLEHLLPESQQPPLEPGGKATGGVTMKSTNLTRPPEDPTTSVTACGGGLNGVLCEIGEIFQDIIAFPGKVADFVVNAFNDLIDFFSPLVDIPDNPSEVLALMGIDINDPNWFADIVSGIPPLRPPCPADGTMIPGLGEVGTTRATFVCKRGLGWIAGAIYDNAPDDIWGVPGKLVLAILYYPVDYLCMCFEEASSVRFDDLQAAHRDLETQNLDVDVSTRASQTNLDAANAAVGDLDSDVAAVQNSLAVIDGNADKLLDGEAAQSLFLGEFRDLALQMRIEATLTANGNDRISMFQLPDTVDGFIEVVQIIVENTIQARLDAGRDVGDAIQEVFLGDESYLAGDYKEAYRHYRNAYQDAVHGGNHGP